MSEDDLKNLMELNSKNKPRVLTMYFEDGGEESVIPYDDYYELQQENQQLKRQLEHLRSGEYHNQLKFERDVLQDIIDKGEVSKEDKKFIDMTHRNTELLEQLQQRDSVIEEAITYINETWWYEHEYQEDKFYFKDNYGADKLLEILNKYKGDSNE